MTNIKLDDDLRVALTAFIEHRDEPPRGRMSPGDAVNVIVRDWLTGQGYLELPTDPNAIVRALEAAKVPE